MRKEKCRKRIKVNYNLFRVFLGVKKNYLFLSVLGFCFYASFLSLQGAGFQLQWLLLWSTGSRVCGLQQ